MKYHKNCKWSPLSLFIEESQLMLRHLTPAIPPREILCSPSQAAWLCVVVTMADDCLHGITDNFGPFRLNLNGPKLSLSHQQIYNRYDLQYIIILSPIYYRYQLQPTGTLHTFMCQYRHNTIFFIILSL